MIGFRKELEENILHFWMENMVDHDRGGFYGRIDGQHVVHRHAPKGVVMHARILWTFSAAYRLFDNERYKEMADRAFDYISEYFVDRDHDGVYWEVDADGVPLQDKKQGYAQGFALYGFSEYYRATARPEALAVAIQFFDVIERFKDAVNGGYWEAFTREWQPIADMRLSDKDANEAKTMNTHLHILEPYTNLLRVWKEPKVERAQRELIKVFLTKIFDTDTGHLRLFFDEKWRAKSDTRSYGHDIEAAWLLIEAAEVLGDNALLEKVKTYARRIGEASKEGLLEDGSLAYEWKEGYFDAERHWWVQAEAVVGFQYLHRCFPDVGYDREAERAWKYICEQLVDPNHGEWFWSRLPNGEVATKEDKAGFWKCPYHNGRMCLEMIEHFSLH
jgi:mannobiose 2-epimerase